MIQVASGSSYSYNYWMYLTYNYRQDERVYGMDKCVTLN